MINEVGDSADEECYSSLNYNSTVPEYSKLKIDDASLASHRPPRPRPRPPPPPLTRSTWFVPLKAIMARGTRKCPSFRALNLQWIFPLVLDDDDVQIEDLDYYRITGLSTTTVARLVLAWLHVYYLIFRLVYEVRNSQLFCHSVLPVQLGDQRRSEREKKRKIETTA